MSDSQLHRTQVSILHSLRYAEAERFNALMKPTGHTSDTFKFHLRKLAKLGYVTKLANGDYQLTALGKEFANNFDEARRLAKKQPKLSVLIVAAKKNQDGETCYLLQQRLRNPYLGFWCEITDAVQWGESFQDAAARVLRKQTGLAADFDVKGMRRIRDFGSKTNTLLEDKLFIIMEAKHITGELQNSYAGGINHWITLKELQKQEKYFASTPQIIAALKSKQFYSEQDLQYGLDDY